jgi:hypothetical protein
MAIAWSFSATASACACSPVTAKIGPAAIRWHRGALRNRNSSFVVDGEAVLLGVDGWSDFNGLHSRRHDAEDLHKLPLSLRETNLARPLARRVDGIHLAPFEQGEIGPDLFRHACLMGLEGLVSKRRDSAYRAGRFDRWVKVKNRRQPAFSRVMDALGWAAACLKTTNRSPIPRKLRPLSASGIPTVRPPIGAWRDRWTSPKTLPSAESDQRKERDNAASPSAIDVGTESVPLWTGGIEPQGCIRRQCRWSQAHNL